MPSTEELAPLPPTEYDEGLQPQDQPPALPQVDAEGNLLATTSTPKKKRNKKL